MDAMLQVRLLGGFQVQWRGCLLAGFGTPRLQALLAYILLESQAPIERARMAFLLWPDSTEAQPQTNLRRELHNLRTVLPEAGRFIDSSGRTLQWRRDAPAAVDLIDFEASLCDASTAEVRGDKAAERGFLERAMAVYGGDLFPARYEDFVLAERERLREKCLAGLEQLVELCAVEGDYQSAIQWSEAVLRLEPLRESACRRLMQFHERSGNRGDAFRVYAELAIDCSVSCKPRPTRRVRRFFKLSDRGTLQRRAPGKKAPRKFR